MICQKEKLLIIRCKVFPLQYPSDVLFQFWDVCLRCFLNILFIYMKITFILHFCPRKCWFVFLQFLVADDFRSMNFEVSSEISICKQPEC